MQRMWLISIRMMIQILLMAMLILAAIIDIKKKEIPVVILGLCGVLAAVSIVIDLIQGYAGVGTALALLPGAVMIFISVITHGELGLGDGLMLLCIGPVFGLESTCVGLFTSLFLSCIFSIGILACKRGNRKSQIPFMPFLSLGMGVALLCARFQVI